MGGLGFESGTPKSTVTIPFIKGGSFRNPNHKGTQITNDHGWEKPTPPLSNLSEPWGLIGSYKGKPMVNKPLFHGGVVR